MLNDQAQADDRSSSVRGSPTLRTGRSDLFNDAGQRHFNT